MNLAAFIRQKPDERLVLQIRRYWLTFVPTLIIFTILFLLPFIISIAARILLPDLTPLSDTIRLLLTLTGSVYCLLILLIFYSSFVVFHLDLSIITNERLVDMEQKGLFSRVISEMDLYQVQDVTTEIKGVFPSVFNYGTLIVENASATVKFVLHKVKDPNKLREIILDLANEDRRIHGPVMPSNDQGSISSANSLSVDQKK
jgi:hypothetical protein